MHLFKSTYSGFGKYNLVYINSFLSFQKAYIRNELTFTNKLKLPKSKSCKVTANCLFKYHH